MPPESLEATLQFHHFYKADRIFNSQASPREMRALSVRRRIAVRIIPAV